jgi:predicted nicotinamide N-methyase
MPASGLTGLPLVQTAFDIAGRRWIIHAVEDQDALLGASEEFAEFPFGLLLWESAPVLAEALAKRPEWVAGRSVLELGAGVGLAGVVARHLGGHVRQTDHIAETLALCRMNAEANGIPGIDVALANWNDWRDEACYDLIIGSDVLYERADHAPVLTILRRNLAPGGRVLLTDPGRDDTGQFLATLESAGWRVERSVIRVPALVPTRPNDIVGVTLIEARRA